MATRLYPTTEDHSLIERFAGVPAGTYALYDALNAKHNPKGAADFGEYQDRCDALHNEMSLPENRNIDKLDNFLLYGWGRFQAPDWLMDIWGMDYVCGGTTDTEKVSMLLNLQGVDLPAELHNTVLTLGVHWC